MNKLIYCILLLFIAVYSYADIGIDESVCRQINYQSTDCQDMKNRVTIEEMKEELDFLRTEHYLELARTGVFETKQEPIVVIKKEKEDVKIITYFEED